jgi:photosystem II stability/assembly factor-like uncharacterized protein
MLRSLSIPLAVAGLASAAAIACSDTSDPSPDSTISAAKRGVTPTLTPQQSGTSNQLIGIGAVNSRVAWAAGAGGTFTVTTDGGNTWRAGVVPGAEALQFRDVEGVSEREAYLLSIGNGPDSRIYKTEDGGQSWTLQFQNQVDAAFYDCFAFWTPNHALAFSDAVNGRFPVLRTTDGESWQDIGDRLPAAQPGEAGFASSGTCTAAQGGKRAWIVTGGTPRARVLATTDGGDGWAAYDTPIVPLVPLSPASGGFSIAFRDPFRGILAGGDLLAPDALSDNVAVSKDGGKTWTLATGTPFPGAVYGLSYVPGFGQRTVVATGPAGVAWSPDEGTTWTTLPGLHDYWAVAFAGHKAGWLVGTEGRILKINF